MKVRIAIQSEEVGLHNWEEPMGDDKREGLITTTQDAIVDTAKAGWGGVKDVVEATTNAVSEVLPTRKRTTPRKKSGASAKGTKKASTGRKPQRAAKSTSRARSANAVKRKASTSAARSRSTAKGKTPRKPVKSRRK